MNASTDIVTQDQPASVPAPASPGAIYRACLAVGASDDVAKILACIAMLHTQGQVAYRLQGHGVGDVVGAWAVCTDVWGSVPSNLSGQASQALRVYNEQIVTLPWTSETLAERCAVSNMAWFQPSAIRSQMPINPVSPVLLSKVNSILSQLGPGAADSTNTFITLAVVAGVIVTLYLLLA